MIELNAGVKPEVNFSSFDKHMALRTDGDEFHCRIEGLSVQSKTKKEAGELFSKCCVARQNANTKHRHTSNEKKCYECENCKCGSAKLKGDKTLPKNVGWFK